MDPSEITRQTLSAWDEIIAEEEAERAEAEAETPPADQPESPSEEPETDDEGDHEEGEDEEVADADGDGDEGEGDEDADDDEGSQGDEQSAAYETDDIEIQAFLAKYDGDVDKALKGAAELSHVLGRQGMEKTALEQDNAALREEVERLRLVASGVTPMNEEQRNWIDQAVGSGNPAYYVQQAVDAGEFELAKALCHEWGREDSFTAGRVMNQVEAIEEQMTNTPQYVDHDLLLKTMVERDPGMADYEQAMIQVVSRLGAEHHIVQDARSNDLMRSITGLQTIYELAKASRASVAEAREKVRTDARRNGDRAKKEAVVTSGNGSPASGGTPRPKPLMPGLTLEALEAAFTEDE